METLCTMSEVEDKADQVMKVELDEEEEDDNGQPDHAGQQCDPEDSEEAKSDNKEESEPPVKTRPWEPNLYSATAKEDHCFAGHEINIHEALDSYGAIIWPAAVALCHFLENNRQEFDLTDKAVLEIGAGTGLLSIVACLLGAWVTSTDLPDVLGNLKMNLMRNTRGRCRYTPQVAVLCWDQDLERTYPHSVYHYDYVLAADVVYHHDYLDELLVTMRHFCQRGTTLIWANKIRFQTDLHFISAFKDAFHTTLLAELPKENIKIFMATCRD